MVGEKIREEKLEMTDMDTGMEGKKDRILSSDYERQRQCTLAGREISPASYK